MVAVEFAIFTMAIGSIYALMEDPAMRTRLVLLLGGSVFIFAALLTLAWTFIDLALLRALSAIEKGSSIIAHTNPAHELELPRHHLLGNLPLTIQTLANKLDQAKNEVGQALQAGAMREQEQKIRLETVLKELSEGVIVCDAQSRLLLYNNATLRILGDNQALGLGRSVYNLLTRAPVEHALQLLRGRVTELDTKNFIELICTTVGSAILLRCRLGLLAPLSPGETISDSGFVLTFQDATAEIDTVNRRDSLFRGVLDDLRRPLANLRAAAENLTAYPSMDIDDRRSFETIITEECKILSDCLNTLSSDSRSLIGSEWAMVDIYSADLGMSIQRRLERTGGPRLTMTGIPLWLRVDSHAVAVLFEYLVRQVQGYNQIKEFDFEPLLGDRRVYIDLVWSGEPIPSATLDSWLNEVLHEAAGSPTVREVLQQHDGDIWSQPHRRGGYSLLRIPLPASLMQWETPRNDTPPPPEFYDFELPRRLSHTGPLMERPLSELDYVVFDTETTGLRPSQGDEIVSIAGVRIVNRRILSGGKRGADMYPRQFDYVAPASLEDAFGALGEGSKVMAGGMSLIPLMKLRLFSPAVVVDIGRIPGLGTIEDGGGHISIGALARHADTASSDVVKSGAAALAAAASLTGDVQVRNQGTTCGALAHADVAADQPAGALACGAVMIAQSSSGTREIPASEFFVDTLTSALNADEILTSIRLPKAGAGEGSAYDKLGRRGGRSDYAVAGAAAWVKKSNGSIEDARVALTGVGTTPSLAEGVAEALIGTDGSDGAVEAAAARALEGVTVLEDLYGSEEYKAHLAKVYVARAITKALAAI
ncbi:MAG: FAD binding domain-containing protein [Pseudomonadota bacterium]